MGGRGQHTKPGVYQDKNTKKNLRLKITRIVNLVGNRKILPPFCWCYTFSAMTRLVENVF